MSTEMEKVGRYTDPLIHGSGPTADIAQYVGGQLNGYAAHSGRSFNTRRVTEAAKLWRDVALGREDPFFLRQAMQPTHPAAVQYLCERYPGLYGNNSSGQRLMGMREAMGNGDYQALYADVLDRLYYG